MVSQEEYVMRERAYKRLGHLISSSGNKGTMIGPEYRRYRIEPVDGTRYEFYIVWLDTAGPEYVKCVVSGVSSGGYVTIGIRDLGSYEFMMESVRELGIHFFQYAFGKFPNCHKWDVVATLLAASILVYNPNNVGGAAEKMLETPQIIEELLGDCYEAEDYE